MNWQLHYCEEEITLHSDKSVKTRYARHWIFGVLVRDTFPKTKPRPVKKVNELGLFIHFKTRIDAETFLSLQSTTPLLVIREKKEKHPKPFTVATPLTHSLFTPESWLKDK